MNIEPLQGGDGRAVEGRHPHWRQAWMRTLEHAWQQQLRSSPAGQEQGAAATVVEATPDEPPTVAGNAGLHAETAHFWPQSLVAARASRATAPSPSAKAALLNSSVADSKTLPAAQPPCSPQVFWPATPMPPQAVVQRRHASDLAATMAASREPIPERHVTALPESGGVAVWVRDASLDDLGREQLAQRLRTALRSDGLDVHRVTVNGRTVYQSSGANPSAPASIRS